MSVKNSYRFASMKCSFITPLSYSFVSQRLCITVDTGQESVYTDIGKENADKAHCGENRCRFSLPAPAKPEMQIDGVNNPGNE